MSEEVLDAIARVLLLDVAEHAHLYRLAGLNTPEISARPSVAPSPEVQRLLDSWSPRPGMSATAIGTSLRHDAARVVFGYGDDDHNCLVSFFTNARYRVLHRHWAETAADVAAAFRADAARYPDDGEFERIAADLAAVSPEFAELWERHDAAEHTHAVKAVDHPEAGTLVFDATLLPLPEHPGHHLILHNPVPGPTPSFVWRP